MTVLFSRQALRHRHDPAYRLKLLSAASIISIVTFIIFGALRISAEDYFDFPIILSINTFSRRSRIVDHALQAISTFDLFQGLPLVALAFGAFAASRSGQAGVRLAIGVFAAAAAAMLSRLIQALMPDLPRPTVDPDLPFRRPYGGSPEYWRDWSSFPSDHATLLWGMAVATLLVNRRIGAVCVAVASLSSLARLYCGLHYATDIVGGALLGSAVVCAALAVAAAWEERVLAFAKQRPALVGTVAFLFGVQAATLFHDMRAIADVTARNVKELGAGSSGEP